MDYCRVGVLAACAGRSTRSKQAFPTNTWPLAPCQGCSKARESRTTFRSMFSVRMQGRGREGRAGQGRAGGRAEQGRAGQGRAGHARNLQGPVPEICQPGAPDPRIRQLGRQKLLNGEGFGVHPYCLTAERSMAGLCHYSPCIPGGFTLPHRSDGTLGWGFRSELRAPMQMVSGALGSLGLLDMSDVTV